MVIYEGGKDLKERECVHVQFHLYSATEATHRPKAKKQ